MILKCLFLFSLFFCFCCVNLKFLLKSMDFAFNWFISFIWYDFLRRSFSILVRNKSSSLRIPLVMVLKAFLFRLLFSLTVLWNSLIRPCWMFSFMPINCLFPCCFLLEIWFFIWDNLLWGDAPSTDFELFSLKIELISEFCYIVELLRRHEVSASVFEFDFSNFSSDFAYTLFFWMSPKAVMNFLLEFSWTAPLSFIFYTISFMSDWLRSSWYILDISASVLIWIGTPGSNEFKSCCIYYSLCFNDFSASPLDGLFATFFSATFVDAWPFLDFRSWSFSSGNFTSSAKSSWCSMWSFFKFLSLSFLCYPIFCVFNWSIEYINFYRFSFRNFDSFLLVCSSWSSALSRA